MSEQIELFKFKSKTLPPRKKTLILDKKTLILWKSRVIAYQKEIKIKEEPQQLNLFDIPKNYDSSTIDPFSLELHSSSFYRMPSRGGENCIYFVIDKIAPLLLYVGETKRTPQKRWSGVHDAKKYIMNYIELHRKYGLDVCIGTAFWRNIPVDRTSRQKIEKELILKWRSPFNKESWRWWTSPFK